MSVPFQRETRASKRKLATNSDLTISRVFSQNSTSSISTRKKQKVSSFSQSLSTQPITQISIFSESPIFEDSKSEVGTQKSQLFVEISQKTDIQTERDQYCPLSSPVASRQPLLVKKDNIKLSQPILDYIRKPEQAVSFSCVKKWQAKQPNDHTSEYPFSSYIIY